MRVLAVEKDKPCYVAEMEDFDQFQEFVGGWVESVSVDETCALLVNEEGKLIGLEPNRFYAPLHEWLHGNIIVVGVGDCDFCSLSQEDIDFWTIYFNNKTVMY